MALKTKKTETDEAQEMAAQEKKTYKVTCGTYSHGEALLRAAIIKKAGINVSIALEKTGYIIIAAKGISQKRAEELKARIEAIKQQADILEI